MKAQKFIPLLVVAAGLLAYHNSFTGPFIFDDVPSIPENPTIRHLWPIWNALAPPHKGGITVEGRPIINLSLAINYALGGLDVRGYHVLNLIIHILAGLTLFGVVRLTLLQPKLRERFGTVANELALAVAVLWTVHPLQTESVTYIIQRAESIMGLLYLLTLYCFIRGTESQKPGFWFACSIMACGLGMATKEVIVSAPLVVLLYDRTFVAGTFAEAWRRRWRWYTGLACTWLVAGGLVSRGVVRGGSAGLGTGVGWQAYALTQTQAITHYLRLSAWPHPLVFDYGTGLANSVGEVVPCALLVAVVLVGTLIALCRWPAVGFLGACFFAILAPTSSVMPVVTQTMAEHRMYLPLAAVVVLGVMGIHAVVGRRTVAVAAVLAVGLGVLTVQRNRDYCSDIAIWDDTVAKCPQNPRAHYNLGLALTQAGRVGESIGHYEQALRISPAYAKAHNNLGFALSQAGRVQDAIAHYEQALRINPDFAEAHCNLGMALGQVGKIEEAIPHYEQALRIKPDFAEAHNNFGVAFVRLGRLPEAMGHYEQALRIKPDYAEAQYNLGLALSQVGKFEEAIGHHEQALRIKPDYAEAHYNLGLALSRIGKIQEAIGHYEQALRIQPDFPEAHCNLGNALEQTGRVREGIGHYEQALRLKPDYPNAQNNLAWLLATLAPTDGGDPVRAVTLAERAGELTNNRVAAYLDTLAVACAAAGRFNDAIATAQKAIGLARSAGQTQIASEIETRLELYRAGRAYRAPAGVTSPHGP
ncbi:MAG: tetratricopeptide repeat protein [Verrucomicrobiia bacterium]